MHKGGYSNKQWNARAEIPLITPAFSRADWGKTPERTIASVFHPRKLIVNMPSDEYESEQIC